jgi:formate C-acetyltransferase
MRTPRIERLRERALRCTFPPELTWEPHLLRMESLRDSRGEPAHLRRRGYMVRHVLSHLTPVIDDDELIVGKVWLRQADAQHAARLKAIECFAAAQPLVGGQSGHAQLDLDLLLTRGTRGVQEDIRRRAATLDPARPREHRQLQFYEAAIEALEGLCAWAAAYAKEAERQAAICADPQRRAELERIAEVCRRVPAYPARTFHEALQSVHFLNAGTMIAEQVGYLVPGRVDRYLLPLYRDDIAAGRLTHEQAQELLDCSWIIISEYVAKGGAVSVMIGGPAAAQAAAGEPGTAESLADEPRPEGCDVTNEITWMALQAVEDVGLSYPSVGIAWHPGTPRQLLDRAIELIARGTSNPAWFNDPVISSGMRRYGVPAADCHEFINSTCVEITPVGASNVWVASPYFNLCAELLGLIDEVVLDQTSAPTFAGFLAAYKQRMSRAIAGAVAAHNTWRETRARHGGKPLQSCFTRDCLERGVDIDEGGARYNWVECSFVGLANLVDSLTNIRRLVCESGELSLADLKRALDTDFECAPELLGRCRESFPRYGNDNPEADALAQDMTAFLAAECAKHEVWPGSPFIPGFFCWVMHEQLGRGTGATPDGRRAGFPFADGAGPSQGSERAGPTAAIRSTTKWDHTPMLGGLVLNLKFTPQVVADVEGRAKLRALLEAAMELGAFEVQVNCVDRETLRAAQRTPELYRDLLVRVAGYSDYFVNLSPQMQAQIIARTQFR